MGKKSAFITKRRGQEVKLDLKDAPKAKEPQAKTPPPPKEDSSGPTSRTHSSLGSRTDLTDVDPDGEGEVLAKRTHDLETLKKLIEDYETLMKVRLALAERNMNPDYELFEKLRSSRKLDANLKKCTNFVKKLKSFTSSQYDQIEKEFQGLNLSKYLSEIAEALTEARFKISDVQSAVDLFSMFHQRYREFRPYVLEIYRKILLPRKADFSPTVVTKLPVDIRLFAELVMCGLFDKDEGFSLVFNSIRNIIQNDKDGMEYITLIITFCRGLGYDMAELVPTGIRVLSEEHGMHLPPNDWIPEQKKEQLKNILVGYYNNCCAEVQKYNETVLQSGLRNRKLLKTRGEVPEDRLVAHSDLTMTFDFHFANVKKLASYVDKELPSLKELLADPEADQADNMQRVLNAEHGTAVLPSDFSVYEDDESRQFYEDIPDMKVYLPQIAYRDNILKTAKQTEEIERREQELANVDEELEVASFNDEEEEDVTETEDVLPSEKFTDDDKSEIKPNFILYLNGLRDCFNAAQIDKVAREFVDSFNTKPNRKKLIETLFRIPWQRVDLLPLWSRLIAILSPVMPEIRLELCQMLLKDFRYLVRKRDQEFIERKLRVVRYIGELVKFGVFPKSDAFQCFKILLMNFTHHQIDMACAFMETCGRFLHRSPESHRRMQIYLEELMRRKAVKSLDARYVNMVDHAYLMVCPPKGGPRTKPPEMFAFIKYVVYDVLQRSNLEESIDIIRALEWEDEEVENCFIDVMSKPWNFRYQQYSVAASLLAAIKPYRSHVPIRVVDNVLEGIIQTMESTHPTLNSKRVSMVNFLGEFYSYRLVGSSEIFTVLYALITRQVYLDHDFMNPFDPADNLFRIRLVCTLLKTCGMFFIHGNSKRKLNCFLKYFQRYYWFKKTSPVWTEYRRFPFIMNDLIEETLHLLRPTWKMPAGFVEACTEVTELEDQLRNEFFGDHGYGDAYQLQDIPEDEAMYETKESPFHFDDDQYQDQEEDPHGHDSTMEMDMDPDAEWGEGTEVVVGQNWEKFKPTDAELADFDAQMERLAIEHGGGRHAKADIPVPIMASPAKGRNKPSETGNGGTISVAVLTRKGNKQQLRHIAIAEDTDFVKRITAAKQAEEQERIRIKQLTLGINLRQQQEEEEEVRHKIESSFKIK